MGIGDVDYAASFRSDIFDASCTVGAGVDDGVGGALSGFRVRFRRGLGPIGRGVGVVFVIDGWDLYAQSGERCGGGSAEQ